MNPLEWLVMLMVAGVCGAIGQLIGGFSRGGCLVSIALGFIGALLGAWLSRALVLPELVPMQIGNTQFPIVWSIAGSAIFVAVLGFIGGRGKSRS